MLDRDVIERRVAGYTGNNTTEWRRSPSPTFSFSTLSLRSLKIHRINIERRAVLNIIEENVTATARVVRFAITGPETVRHWNQPASGGLSTICIYPKNGACATVIVGTLDCGVSEHHLRPGTKNRNTFDFTVSAREERTNIERGNVGFRGGLFRRNDRGVREAHVHTHWVWLHRRPVASGCGRLATAAS